MKNKEKDKTLDYYDNNTQAFVDGTCYVDFTSTQNRFLNRISQGAFILDFGCGSGRDTKYFLEKGYKVEATDGSKELCKFASDHTGIEVKHMLFQELDEVRKYDAIWACSSILHLPMNELPDVMKKMCKALKDKGVIYTSFKYSEFEGERNGRYFTDMTEEKFHKFLEQIPELIIEDLWVTTDVRPGRGEERWLNLILRKE